jgi:hypothetical protein
MNSVWRCRNVSGSLQDRQCGILRVGSTRAFFGAAGPTLRRVGFLDGLCPKVIRSPRSHLELSAREEWEIDGALDILDWDRTGRTTSQVVQVQAAG